MNNLKRRRLALDLSATEIAKKLGVSTAAYSSWETGKRTPEPGFYRKLAKVFNCTAEEIVTMIADIQDEADRKGQAEASAALAK